MPHERQYGMRRNTPRIEKITCRYDYAPKFERYERRLLELEEVVCLFVENIQGFENCASVTQEHCDLDQYDDSSHANRRRGK